MQTKRSFAVTCLITLVLYSQATGSAQFAGDFAPAEGLVAPVEKPARAELCLNGSWQFQPVRLPQGYVRDRGEAPELSAPAADRWETTALKVPSPWNVNTWGSGRNVGAGTAHPYWPDSVYYPSYPASWDGVEMGWLRRAFRVPADWAEKRIVLHFEAVAGECQVIVNGQKAGEHFDNYIPFDLDITDLVKRDGNNELLLGIRGHRLFNKHSQKYPHFIAPYPPGSNTEGLNGIWQDVYLLGLPAVRVDDVFVKPMVDQDTLEAQVTLKNDAETDQTIQIVGDVRPWINLAGRDTLGAPEPKWNLGEAVLQTTAVTSTIPKGGTKVLILSQKVSGKLKFWSPASPELYGLTLHLTSGGKPLDTRYTRFGWRQITISGKDVLLNGEKVQCVGDLCHPFGPYMMSRRFVWAWYTMIKDMGGNAVRPHAQPYPRSYLDVADEMGILVLDETAMFGSSIQLNFEEPVAWDRYAANYDGLILRDRNHPSVIGWSAGNELFAIFRLNNVAKEDADIWYAKLAEYAHRATSLDPTHPWISIDGDEDLRGTLPIWSHHFGHGLPLGELPKELDKPLMVGESGGTYYARPAQLAQFNGDRAYEGYAGRNEALAIDVYQNVAKMARPFLAYFSASETIWFGLEHLNLGYSDYSRLPTLHDGVMFAKPFEEGKPGMQLERIPPYVATLNPGFDAALPLYKPLAMFEAIKAAMHPGASEPCAWDHAEPQKERQNAPAIAPTIAAVDFTGDPKGDAHNKFELLGIPFTTDSDAKMLIVDGTGLSAAMVGPTQQKLKSTLAAGGVIFVVLFTKPTDPAALNQILPAPLDVTDRAATALVPGEPGSAAAGFNLPNLYFAEDSSDRHILKHGLGGPLVEKGKILLSASKTDWSQFNEVPEVAKCGAIVLYEHLQKPAGAALVEIPQGEGKLYLCSIDFSPASSANHALWRRLMSNVGVKLLTPKSLWLLPSALASEPGELWKYTTESPADGWTDGKFDDSAWKSGRAGFGNAVPNSKPRTDWRTDDIWLRRTFELADNNTKDLKLVLHHDEDVEVYLNGVLAVKRSGFVGRYEAHELEGPAAEALHAGKNTIAIHCHQTAGGQYVDLGIARGMVPEEMLAPEHAHDLLLNGPMEQKK